MSIRMIAIDLDGTLLHDDMTISAYSREVIQKAIQKGYEIVVATGRMWDSARSKVALLRLGNVPVICYTGAWIMWSETGGAVDSVCSRLFNLSNNWFFCVVYSFSYVLLRLNRRLQTESTAPQAMFL